jgi:hypothetical protein
MERSHETLAGGVNKPRRVIVILFVVEPGLIAELTPQVTSADKRIQERKQSSF